MFEAEVKIMKFYKFDLAKFRVNDHYSLLFCLLASLKASDEVAKQCFIYLNESFLSSSLSIEDYPEVVASCIALAITNSKEAEETTEFNEAWCLSHYFSPQKVTRCTGILRNFLGAKGVIFKQIN